MRVFIVCLILSLFLSSPAFAESNDNEQAIDPQLKAVLIEAIQAKNDFVDRFDVEVWLVDMSMRLERWLKDDEERLLLLKHVHLEASRAKISPELVLAVIQVESNFDKFAISRVGARGLMQIMPFWLKELNRPKDNLFEIPTNLRFGCTILKYYLDMEKGNKTRALARYNGSLGRFVYPNKVFKALDNTWRVN